MHVAGDLTDSSFWDGYWAAAPAKGRRLAPLQHISQWKFDRMIRRMLDAAGAPTSDVLELGCAPGTMLQRIHRLRPQLRLSGIDYAEQGCRTTAAALQQMGLPPNVHYGDVRSVQLPKQFDVVVSFGLVEHFDDPVEILLCHARFCRPGGHVAVSMPCFTSPVARFLTARFCPDLVAIHNLEIMNLRTLRAAMHAAGLTNVRVGGDGGHKLYPVISRRDPLSKAYAAAARLWNAAAVLVPPQLGWNANLWAVGQVPERQ